MTSITDVDKQVTFEGAQVDALRAMVQEWINEGFDSPPYTAAQYDVFEALGLDRNVRRYTDNNNDYDTRRPR